MAPVEPEDGIDYEAQATLQTIAVAEENYFIEHGTYSSDPDELSVDIPDGMSFELTSDFASFCAQVTNDAGTFSYPSHIGSVIAGANC